MWFVSIDSSREASPDCQVLVGFATDHLADGMIINEMEFVTMPVFNEQQVGAISWSRATGEVDQIYVAPDMRRSEVGRRLTHAASAFHQTHGWPGVIHASRRRTELGQMFMLGKGYVSRQTPHTELAPPMDPA